MIHPVVAVFTGGLFLVASLLAVANVVQDRRNRGTPSHVQVARLRDNLRVAASDRQEAVVEPATYRTLSVEMILIIARSEGFRLLQDICVPQHGRRTRMLVLSRTERFR